MARRLNKSHRIRKLLEANPPLSTVAIAELVGATPNYVYNVAWKARKNGELKAKKIREMDIIDLGEFIFDAPSKESEPAIETPPLTVANTSQIGGSHYKTKAIQPWDYIAANNLGYMEGNIVKYVSRYREKGGVADLEKAKHYLEKLIELERM